MTRFMAIALAVSGLCLGSSARADEAEDKTIAYVKRLGGAFTLDDKAPGKPVVAVSLAYKPVTDAGLKELARSRASPPSACLPWGWRTTG